MTHKPLCAVKPYIKSENPEYTVSGCRLKDDILYGPSHGSNDAIKTLCGKKIDHHMWITSNRSDGKITCKKCLKVLRKSLKGINKGCSMKITKGNTFFVSGCSENIIDLINKHMNYTMSGNGMVMVGWEEIISWLEEYQEDCDIRNPKVTKEDEEFGQFLGKVEQAIKEEVGDVIFCR